jgi:hypothetical protein
MLVVYVLCCSRSTCLAGGGRPEIFSSASGVSAHPKYRSARGGARSIIFAHLAFRPSTAWVKKQASSIDLLEAIVEGQSI